ncbi:MAG: protein translocase subunit SecD [Planctomycetota bacterium]
MKYPIWKPILLVLVVASAFALFYPPAQRLKPGIDLAGGTSLTYEVQVPEGRDVEQAIEDTIDVLRERVDPQGVMNLVWRPVAGTRLEVQMPAPGPKVKERREAFIEAQEALLESSVTAQSLTNLAAAEGEAREAAIERLSADVDEATLRAMVARYDELQAATPAYEATQEASRQAERSLAELGPTATADERGAADAAVDALRGELIRSAEVFLDARDAYEAARLAALAGSVSEAQVDAVVSQPTTVPAGQATSPRDDAVAALKAEYPGRAADIDAFVDANSAYEEVKGPLDDPNDLKKMLQGSGALSFRITAMPEAPMGPPISPSEIERYRELLAEKGPDSGRREAWWWYPVDDVTQFANDADDRAALATVGPAAYLEGRGYIGEMYGGETYMLASNVPGSSITQRELDWKVTRVDTTTSQDGFPAILVNMNPVGGALMAALTQPNVGRPMAILLDGRVLSAPNINDRLRETFTITGRFSQAEIAYMLRTMRAGSLEASLSKEPISERTFDSSIGADNISAGLQAAIGALVLVAIFMVMYYFGLGLVANIALVANLCLILGMMAMLNATFTLPGIAGIVLTIGMAVDANVLIFERIREETNRGADTPTAVRIGFDKAFSTIIDANLTTFITCVVLYYTATAEIKGFATTLMVGIIATLFTCLFGSRVIVEMAMIFGRVRSLPVLPSAVSVVGRALSPSVNWIGKRYAFFVLSAVLMVAGLTTVVMRGADLLDIEFRSGTQVSFVLADDQRMPVAEARERLAAIGDELGNPLIAQAAVVAQGEFNDQGSTGFGISSLEEDSAAVSDAVKAAFDDVLESIRPLAFDGVEIEDDAVNRAPVFALETSDLGAAIDRPGLGMDVDEYVGGVAIVLEGLTPSPTLSDVERRIAQMRNQPLYESLGYRPFEVIGLSLAPGADPETGEALYETVVVVAKDPQFSYAEAPDAFAEAGGLSATEWALVKDALTRSDSLDSVNSFSPQVSGTMQQQAIVAMLLSILAVVGYIWLRFGSIRYGIAAIVALVHDVSITLGLVAISGWLQGNTIMEALLLDPFKIDIAMVAAMLTIVGYSLNDTIVVFDRIRENRGRLSHETPEIINRSINQTISRTVLTSGTTLMAILTLYILGGDGVHGFAFAMLIGVAVGTYSSIAIASPMLMLLGGVNKTAEPETRGGVPVPA